MAREVFFLSETRDGRCIRDKNKMVYHKNTILPRGDAIGFHTARPFESNKVGCAERAISGLTLVSRRKPSLAHTPCAEFIVIGVFDRGRIKGKKKSRVSGRFHPRVTPPWESQPPAIRRDDRVSRPQAFGPPTLWGNFFQDVYGDVAVAVTRERPRIKVGIGSTRVEAVKISTGTSASAEG